MSETFTKHSDGRRWLRYVINTVMVIVLAALGLLIWQRFVQGTVKATQPVNEAPTQVVQEELLNQDTSRVNLTPLNVSQNLSQQDAIYRQAGNHTIIPDRPIESVITYTVQRDDTLFGIADTFGLKPETILWGNFETLQDNPHLLKPDQVLNILPVDGTYYEWQSGDNIAAVASFFGTEPEEILGFPGNEVDLTSLTENGSGIDPGKWVIVPNGKRAIKDWGPPAITRQNPASAKYYGEGSCGSIYEGAIGTGTFVWPTVARSLSGYNYSGIHPAIDITGAIGNAVFASDSGVVVYAGWSNYGYGYMIVIDHGNGFQTAYAHLSAVAVTCGQSVFQGGYIGAIGDTGNSYGSHLHFELIYGGAKLNPSEYLR